MSNYIQSYLAHNLLGGMKMLDVWQRSFCLICKVEH
jgi:hypothetical protein